MRCECMIDWTRYRRTQTETPDSHKPVSTKPGTVYINPLFLRRRVRKNRYHTTVCGKPRRWVVECDITPNGPVCRFNDDVVEQAKREMLAHVSTAPLKHRHENVWLRFLRVPKVNS